MPRPAPLNTNSRIAILAILIAMAVILHWFEAFIPRPVPFLRLGLANIFTLCALYMFGGMWGLVVVVSRVFIGSLFSGSIFTPTFLLSLTGGTVAALVMWGLPKTLFSPIGVSVGGATSHSITQIIIASAIIVRHISLLHLIPVLFVVSVATGIANGYCAKIILRMVKKNI
ncbi:MAG: Gx transporter family protein [Thermodesulfobacteriota bacterium]|nr:Gx transporter family protein [Thermodesulfobacteriota bacterium]